MRIVWLFLGALLLFAAQRWLYQRFWARRLRLELRFDRESATAGEDVILHERVLNGKWLPLPMLRYHYGLGRNLSPLREENRVPVRRSARLAAPAMRAVRRQSVLPALARGVYTINDAVLCCQDLFFTCSLTQPVQSFTRLTVYPEKLPAQRLALPYRLLLGAVLTRRRAQEDPFELRGVRPYESYDSMRRINWKASARTGELKVNQYDYTTDEALLLLVDVEHGSVDAREALVSLASSLSSLFLRRGISVSLCANGRSCFSGRPISIQSGSGSDHQRVIDESLAQLKLGAEPTAPMADYLDALCARRQNALCVLLSAQVDPALAAAFDRLCGQQHGYLLSQDAGCTVGRSFSLLPWPAETEAPT